jgi:hypothetical protein
VRLVAVCHDAGGAEQVAAWIARRRDELALTCVLGGPAAAVFARRLGAALRTLPALPPLAGADLVLCGSSGAADLERRAVRAARAAGVRSAVWLDHWRGFRVRFLLDGELVLPDEVWVSDEYAERLARAELPEADVRLVGNPYLEDMAASVHALERPRDGGERVLYVTEPSSVTAAAATGDPRGWGYTEFEALDACLAVLARRTAPPRVRVRMHPAEPAGKYDELLGAYAGRLAVEVGAGHSLAEDCAWAQTVIGCETMALVVAVAAGRRVVTSLPAGVPLSLPFPEIERLHEA